MPLALSIRFLRARLRRPTRPAAHRAARRRARNALAGGVLAFVALSAALAVATETEKPEWRDPEYGHRIRQLRKWRAVRPDRPRVLVFGSSRAQFCVAPGAMGFGPEAGEPLLYNFGYRGAHPLGVRLQFDRALDDGADPRAVVVVLSAPECAIDGAAEEQFSAWGDRFSARDLRRLAPETKDPSVFRRARAGAIRNSWAARRGALVSDFLRDWQPVGVRLHHEGWERMFPDGWVPFPEERLTEELRARLLAQSLSTHGPGLARWVPGTVSDRALRGLAARCRAEGIALAFAWAPESPAYRAEYSAAVRAALAEYSHRLTAGSGAPVFPAPDCLEERDFADGYHTLPVGAIKYSQWLSEKHLKPWLAGVLK